MTNTSGRTVLVMIILRCQLDIQLEVTFYRIGFQNLDLRGENIHLGSVIFKAMGLVGNHLQREKTREEGLRPISNY